MFKRLGQRFELVPGMHRPKLVRNGAIFLVLFGALMAFAYSGGKIPFWPKGGYTVTADFADAANVSPGKTPVRVRGVKVGEVESVERVGDHARVKMRIDNDDVKVRRDARADIYWRTLLGFAFYIELDPGSSPARLGDAVIPQSSTTTQVEADQLLTALKAPSRAGLQTFFGEVRHGFKGATVGRTLDVLGPSMRQIAPGLEALQGTQSGDLSNTVRNASKLTGALVKSERELAGFFPALDGTLAVTARREADLRALMQRTPAALDENVATMRRLRTTLDVLDPVAAALRPGARRLDESARDLRPALTALQPLLDDAKPFLTRVRPALRDLRGAARAGLPALQRLEPTLARMNEKILPWANARDNFIKLKNYELVAPTIATVASSAGNFDTAGHTQRFQAVAGSGDSLAFLPCTLDYAKYDLDCSDIEQLAGAVLFGGKNLSAKAARQARAEGRAQR